MTAVDYAAALSSVAGDELSRRRLLDFGSLLYPRFQAPAHIMYIAELLEQIEAGTLRNLCVSVPVRHGKSVLCSQIFPAWYLGRHPTEPIILTSHAESLAVINSRAAKRLVEDERWPFEGVRMSSDSSAVGRWNVTQGGGVYAVGVGGSITGRGANVLIVDDPLHDGLSEAERESAWRWFREVAVPRLDPGGAIIVVGARFTGDDVVGRIADSDSASEWTFVRLPALAEEGDPLGRSLGAPLWPERVSLEEIERRRALMASAAFEAQFQQNPLPAGGLIFRSEWFQNFYDVAPGRYSAFRCLAIDPAFTAKKTSDASAISCWATNGRQYFLLDSVAKRLEFPDLVKIVREKYFELKPHIILIEAAASGHSLAQSLSTEASLPVTAIAPRGDKVTRANAITVLFETGKVLLPRSAPWLDAWLQEHLRFPSGRHDDMVDTTSLALSYLSEHNLAAEIGRERESQWSRFSTSR